MADEKSGFDTALPWLALAAGVGGLAYATTRPAKKAAAPAAEGSAATKRRRKKRKKAKASADGQAEAKRPASPYNEFVRKEMPALQKQGYSPGEAMKKISEKWKAKKG